MRICIVLGTRPEIIKMSPIIRYCESNKLDYFIIHTGQHYSYNMDKLFFEELNLDNPKYALDLGPGPEKNKIRIKEIKKVLEEKEKEKPSVVLVEGDTFTVLAGALAASKLHIKVGHVEAGLRSYDKRMKEERIRIKVDHISDYLFCPTENQKKILVGEKIEEEKIFITGNTIVDAVQQNLELAKGTNILDKFKLKKDSYILVTAHRPENVDHKEILKEMFEGLKLVYDEFKIQIIYPIHPRTKKVIKEFDIKIPEGLNLIEPVGFLEFLQLEANAKLILTDSGGVQEESCILKVPCVTLRENTERPETIDVGSNMLAGTDPKKILDCAKTMIEKNKDWENPFGDGKAGEKIINIILNKETEK